MSLVYDDALGGDGEEMGAMAVALNIVEADDNHRMMFEERNAGGEISLEACDAGGR
jgi:hypothetical protein